MGKQNEWDLCYCPWNHNHNHNRHRHYHYHYLYFNFKKKYSSPSIRCGFVWCQLANVIKQTSNIVKNIFLVPLQFFGLRLEKIRMGTESIIRFQFSHLASILFLLLGCCLPVDINESKNVFGQREWRSGYLSANMSHSVYFPIMIVPGGHFYRILMDIRQK